MDKSTEEKNIIINRKASFEYFIMSRIEAGIVLVGTEVKSLRQNRISLVDSFAVIEDNEVYLINANINVYDHGNINNHDPIRKRKLLLNRNEIRKLNSKLKEKGLTLIPLRLYFKNGKVKVEIGLARGKKSYDKREAIAKKDFNREKERNFS